MPHSASARPQQRRTTEAFLSSSGSAAAAAAGAPLGSSTKERPNYARAVSGHSRQRRASRASIANSQDAAAVAAANAADAYTSLLTKPGSSMPLLATPHASSVPESFYPAAAEAVEEWQRILNSMKKKEKADERQRLIAVNIQPPSAASGSTTFLTELRHGPLDARKEAVPPKDLGSFAISSPPQSATSKKPPKHPQRTEPATRVQVVMSNNAPSRGAETAGKVAAALQDENHGGPYDSRALPTISLHSTPLNTAAAYKAAAVSSFHSSHKKETEMRSFGEDIAAQLLSVAPKRIPSMNDDGDAASLSSSVLPLPLKYGEKQEFAGLVDALVTARVLTHEHVERQAQAISQSHSPAMRYREWMDQLRFLHTVQLQCVPGGLIGENSDTRRQEYHWRKATLCESGADDQQQQQLPSQLLRERQQQIQRIMDSYVRSDAQQTNSVKPTAADVQWNSFHNQMKSALRAKPKARQVLNRSPRVSSLGAASRHADSITIAIERVTSRRMSMNNSSTQESAAGRTANNSANHSFTGSVDRSDRSSNEDSGDEDTKDRPNHRKDSLGFRRKPTSKVRPQTVKAHRLQESGVVSDDSARRWWDRPRSAHLLQQQIDAEMTFQNFYGTQSNSQFAVATNGEGEAGEGSSNSMESAVQSGDGGGGGETSAPTSAALGRVRSAARRNPAEYVARGASRPTSALNHRALPSRATSSALPPAVHDSRPSTAVSLSSSFSRANRSLAASNRHSSGNSGSRPASCSNYSVAVLPPELLSAIVTSPSGSLRARQACMLREAIHDGEARVKRVKANKKH